MRFLVRVAFGFLDSTMTHRLRALLVLSVLASAVGAQQQSSSVLRAHVTDTSTGAPISGAEVTVVGMDRRMRTDSSGAAVIAGLAAGRVTVEARRVGFAPGVREVTIPARDTIDVVLALHSSTQALPTMTTLDSANSHKIPEFEARLKSHIGGYFVTESEIRKNQSGTIANLIRTKVPGVNPVVNPDRSTTLYSTRSVEKCRVLTFLDGVRMLQEDIGVVGLESLGGIEFYPPGYVPAQYRVIAAIESTPRKRDPGANAANPERGPRAECGVLLLWTRR